MRTTAPTSTLRSPALAGRGVRPRSTMVNHGGPGVEERPSLYERLGGESAIMEAVDLFYDKVLADPLTAPFFAGFDMDGQTKKQVAFMTVAFGGPNEYRGRNLRSAHAKL